MRRPIFAASQIVEILKAGEGGLPVAEVIRKHGNSRATCFIWKQKYGGVTGAELKHLKERETENAKRKRMYAELALENTAIKDVLSRKLSGRPRSGRWR